MADADRHAPPVRQSHPRLEGVAKVTGAARYVDDVDEDAFGSAFSHGVVVTSTIPVGRIIAIDASAALSLPGVHAVMTHGNAPRLRKITAVSMSEIGELLPLQSDQVVYQGQCVTVVVADSAMLAGQAAALVRVSYEASSEPCAATLARIIEPAIARSQLVDGTTWGIGQALFEQTRVDRRSGRWISANLAEALVATHADIRSVEAIMVDDDEPGTHPLGMKGVSEIGVIGPAPAIGNAIFDAIGKRVRSLPMTIDKRIEAV